MINESLLQPDTPSALDICNAALSKIGEAPLDALIANESTASRLCVLHYHPARRETLCMARWTFATTQTTLDSVSAQAPNSLTPYQFTLPADCLRVLDVECTEWKMQGRRIHASRAPLPMSVWQVVSIRSICWLKETCASLPFSLSHAATADLISLWVIVLAAPQSSSFTA